MATGLEFLPLIGSAISGFMGMEGARENREAQERFNASQIEQAEKNRAAQYEFAQKGISWKAQDAINSGISPLYALGANTTSFAPVALGGGADTSTGSAIASSGQDISRALSATATAAGRSSAFTQALEKGALTKLDLENQLLASKVAQQKTGTPPAMPALPGTPFKTGEEDDPQERPQLGNLGGKWLTYPGAANAEEWEKRYGDPGEWVAGIFNGLQDFGYNLSHPPRNAASFPAHQKKMQGYPKEIWEYVSEIMKRRRYGGV